MYLQRSLYVLGAVFYFAATPALVAEERDQRRSLFNPVPVDSMRDMSTDRPDTTESPYTVDAGHFQLEMSFFDYSRSGRGDDEAWSFGLMNFKVGLLEDTDLQFIFDTWSRERSHQTLSGFGDVTLRLKQNLWGNDSGTTAFALMPYVKIPTGTELSNGQWEGGLIAPFSIALSDRLNLGLMAEMDIVHDEDGGGHKVEWLHSGTLGIALTDQLGMFVELVGIAGAQSDYQALFNTGLTFSVSDDLIFDTGVRLGLNDATEDFGLFTGMSIRF